MRDSRLFDSVVGSASDLEDDDIDTQASTAGLVSGEPVVGEPAADPRIGTRIGHIRLDGLVGQGGMGTVYEGWDEKLRRRVAVKAVSQHYRDDENARARFLREARLLSKLQHPNICQIHDHVEGPDSDYLVLELIQGRSLRDVLKEKGALGLSEGLRIARQLGEALTAAHGRGVAHRDLKPGNVMITPDGTVKVLDFGLALPVERAVERRRQKAGLDWSDHDLSGDSDGGPGAADSETDLANTMVPLASASGGTAIEGTLPYMSPEQARSQPAIAASDIYSFGLLLQEIFTGSSAYPPNLPLTFLLVKVGRGETVPAKGLDPDLIRLIERMKSLAPGSRPSAEDVVERLRWIATKPRRRARRIAIGAFIVLLIAFAATMTFQRSRIAEEAARANREAEAARQTSDFLVELFEVSDPWNTEASNVTARELLDRGSQRIRGELEEQPLTRARLLGTIGDVNRRLGFFDRARPMLEEALDLRRRHTAEPQDLARGLAQMAELESDEGEYDVALEHLESALEMQRATLGEDHPQVADSTHRLGFLYYRRGDYDRAIEVLEQAVTLADAAYGPRSIQAAEVLGDLALALQDSGRYELAEELHLRVLEVREALLPDDHPLIGVSFANLGMLYYVRGQRARAVPLFERDLEIATAAFGPEHPDVAISHNNLGGTLRDLGRLAEAERHSLRSLEIRRQKLGDDHASVGVGMHGLARLYRDMGRGDEAERLFLRSLEIWRQAYGDDHPYVAASLVSRASLYLRTGRAEEALGLLRQGLEIRRQHYGPDGFVTVETEHELASALLASGGLDEAEALLQRVLTAVDAILGEDSEHSNGRFLRGEALRSLALVADARGDAAQAESYRRQARSVLQPLSESTEPVDYDVGLVLLLLDMGLDAEAEPLARELLALGLGRPDLVDPCRERGWV